MKKKIELIKKLIPVDFVRRLKDENVYLKTEIKEEKEKLENTIKTLNKELEEVKEDNRKLINEIDYYEQLREKMHYTR